MRIAKRMGVGCLVIGATLTAVACGSTSEPSPPTEAELEEARALALAFARELMGELQSAIESDGPASAIEVCAAAAPSAADDISEQEGWSIGRTALRVRNPRNAPSTLERAVLTRFLERGAAGESLERMEYATTRREGDITYIHYMRAIQTAQLCTTCHGTDLDAELREAIGRHYPADAATGFEAGDLRGAFTFVRPR